MILLVPMPTQVVHGDIRHLENYLEKYPPDREVHGDIRHLENALA